MGSFGANLRRERELRGISLEEIAQHTKLSTRVLEAIEKNRFDLLPGGMFNRSFVLHYARYLGLDEGLVASDYDHQFGESALDIRQVATQRDQRSVPEGLDWSFLEKLQPLRGLLAGILIAVIVIASGLMAMRLGLRSWVEAAVIARMERRSPVPPPPALHAPARPPAEGSGGNPAGAMQPTGLPAASSAPQGAGQPASAPAALPGPVGMSGVAAASAPAANAQKAVAPLADASLVLQIDTPLDAAWVEVIADGRTQWSGQMNRGESRRVKASSKIQLKTGNAGGVILTLNGETQPPLGARGEVKTMRFSLQDVKKP